MDEELRETLERKGKLIRSIAKAQARSASKGYVVSGYGDLLDVAEDILDLLPVPCNMKYVPGETCRHESCVRAYREEES